MDQLQVRNTLAQGAKLVWDKVCPWDEGDELQQFLWETGKNKVWGEVYKIAVAAQLWDVHIHVHHIGHAAMEFGLGKQRIDLVYGVDNGTATGT